MKRNGTRECIACNYKDERRDGHNGGICKLKICKGNACKGQCPICGEWKDIRHILLRYSESKVWKINLKCKKLLF
jgi:hypothetical protein